MGFTRVAKGVRNANVGRVGIGTQSWQDSGETDRSSRSIRPGRSSFTVFHKISRLMLKQAWTSRFRIAMMLFQGMPASSCQVGSVTWDACGFADSFDILDQRQGQLAVCLRVVPHPSLRERLASRAASSIWHRRIASCSRILNFSYVQHLLPEVGTQVLSRPQVDFASCEQLRQCQLHAGDAQ